MEKTALETVFVSVPETEIMHHIKKDISIEPNDDFHCSSNIVIHNVCQGLSYFNLEE